MSWAAYRDENENAQYFEIKDLGHFLFGNSSHQAKLTKFSHNFLLCRDSVHARTCPPSFRGNSDQSFFFSSFSKTSPEIAVLLRHGEARNITSAATSSTGTDDKDSTALNLDCSEGETISSCSYLCRSDTRNEKNANVSRWCATEKVLITIEAFP